MSTRKFRAWDKKEKELLPVLLMTGSGSKISVRKVNGDYIWQNKDTFILDQWSGEYDKDGVEIFEGDIIEFRDDGDPFNITSRAYREVVMFQKGAFMYEGMWDYDGCSRGFEDTKVIGNIHYNIDLIG